MNPAVRKPALNLNVLAGKRILAAEDDKMSMKLLTTIFNKWGIEYDIVENGTLAFELFEKRHYDIILTDIYMPGVGGISLTNMIRSYPDKAKASIPVLALTANALTKDLEEYKAAGMNDHVVKPYTEENLFEKIENNLA